MTLTRLSASKIGRLCLLEQSNAATGEPETYRMLSYRPKAELEWIATMVRQALGLLPAETRPELAAIPDRSAAVAPPGLLRRG